MPNKDDGSISDKEKDQNKKEAEKRSKESADYAKKMWHEIEKKARSKGQREGLKEEVKEDGQERKKKRRHRKRKGPRLEASPGTASTVSSAPKQEFKPKETFKVFTEEPPKPTVLPQPPAPKALQPKPPEPKVPEPKPVPKPPEPKPEKLPSAPPVMPVNPFAETILPPKQYEDRYSEKKKEEELEPADEGDEIIPESPFNQKPEKKNVPINPFAPVVEQKPVEKKVAKDQYDANINAQAHEKKSVRDTGETREVQSPDVSGMPTAISADDERTEKAEVKSEEQVIEVETKERKEKDYEDVIPGNVETIESEKNVEQPQEFKEEFWDILEHAGITKKRLVFIAIAIVVLILGFLFFSFDLFGGEEDDSSTDVEVVREPDSVNLIREGDAYDIIASYIFGLEYTPIEALPIGFYGDISGIQAAFIFGQTADLNRQQFVEYVALFRQLENIYAVNLYDLVNLAVDRRATLDQHLLEMKGLIDQAKTVLVAIDQRLTSIDAEYELVTTQRDLYEHEFFNSLNALSGENANEFLDLFVANSQKSIALKAEFNAIANIQQMFLNGLALLEPRYADIQANKEALIKGVKVFDVPSSDIDAIIPLQ